MKPRWLHLAHRLTPRIRLVSVSSAGVGLLAHKETYSVGTIGADCRLRSGNDECLPRINKVRVRQMVRDLQSVNRFPHTKGNREQGIPRLDRVTGTGTWRGIASRRGPTRYVQHLSRVDKVGVYRRIRHLQRADADAKFASDGVEPVSPLNGIRSRNIRRRWDLRTRCRRRTRLSCGRDVNDLSGVDIIGV